MIPIKFIISSLVTVNCKLFLSQLAYLLVCSTSNSTVSLKKLSNISHSVLSDNSECMFKSFRETFSLVTSSITTGFFRWLFFRFGFPYFLSLIFLFWFFCFLGGSSPSLLFRRIYPHHHFCLVQLIS